MVMISCKRGGHLLKEAFSTLFTAWFSIVVVVMVVIVMMIVSMSRWWLPICLPLRIFTVVRG